MTTHPGRMSNPNAGQHRVLTKSAEFKIKTTPRGTQKSVITKKFLRMYGSNHNPGMGADDMFNPIKKASMVAKFDLNSVQHVAISSAEAAAQHERNLQSPLIGPDMKRKIALDREIAEFAPEEEHRELDMRKAIAKLLLHGKATRMMRDGEFEEGNASHDALKQFALQSRDPLKTKADNATAI